MCQKKAEPNEKLLKCHNVLCSSGNFFHLTCMSYKRYPSNAKTTWVCNNCKISTPNSRPSTPVSINSETPIRSPSSPASIHSETLDSGQSTSTPISYKISTPKSRPSTPVSISSEIPISSPSSPASIRSETLDSGPSTSTPIGSQTSTSDPEVIFIGTTIKLNVDKTSSLGI